MIEPSCFLHIYTTNDCLLFAACCIALFRTFLTVSIRQFQSIDFIIYVSNLILNAKAQGIPILGKLIG
jgi:hypothetical protein